MANDLSAYVPVTLTLASTYLLHSSLLLCGTWLFVRLGRVHSETLKERLWKSAAVLGLITAPSQLILGISPATFAVTYHETQTEDVTAIAADPPSIEVPARVSAPLPEIPPTRIRDALPERVAELRTSRIDDVVVSPSADERRSVLVETSHVPPSFQTARAHGRPVLNWITGVLVGISCMGLARMCLQTIFLALRLNDCVDVRDQSICGMFDEITRRGRVRRRFRLLVSPTFGQPAAFGLFRWTIVLPEDVVGTFEPNELYALLSHEAAHLEAVTI
jgi:hypothetical protein